MIPPYRPVVLRPSDVWTSQSGYLLAVLTPLAVRALYPAVQCGHPPRTDSCVTLRTLFYTVQLWTIRAVPAVHWLLNRPNMAELHRQRGTPWDIDVVHRLGNSGPYR